MIQETLSKQAYNAIRQKILACEYEPGSIVSEDFFCKELDISRTPVRDAIGRLEQEKLVRVIPKKGIVISGISFGELVAIYDARLLLEPQIILKHGKNANIEELSLIREHFASLDMSKQSVLEYSQKDTDFHGYIFSIARNEYLDNTYLSMSNQNFRISVLGGAIPLGRREKSREEHIRVIDYMLEKDYKAAADEMEKHIYSARQSKLELLIDNSDLLRIFGLK